MRRLLSSGTETPEGRQNFPEQGERSLPMSSDLHPSRKRALRAVRKRFLGRQDPPLLFLPQSLQQIGSCFRRPNPKLLLLEGVSLFGHSASTEKPTRMSAQAVVKDDNRTGGPSEHRDAPRCLRIWAPQMHLIFSCFAKNVKFSRRTGGLSGRIILSISA